MTRRYRQRRINPFLPTEEYNKAVERRNNPTKQDIARKNRYEVTVQDDMFIRALYAECSRLNSLEPVNDDPWEVDHIRPIWQDGRHVYENLRLLRRSKNRNRTERSDDLIDAITRIVAANRRQGYIS